MKEAAAVKEHKRRIGIVVAVAVDKGRASMVIVALGTEPVDKQGPADRAVVREVTCFSQSDCQALPGPLPGQSQLSLKLRR